MYNFLQWQKYNKLEDNYTCVWSVLEKQAFELVKEITARELQEFF